MPEIISVEQLRKHLGEYVHRAHYGGQITHITRNGKLVASIIPYTSIEETSTSETREVEASVETNPTIRTQNLTALELLETQDEDTKEEFREYMEERGY